MTTGISTHSLTKRLTITIIRRFTTIFYFNSQPHEEADIFFKLSVCNFFISTHSLTKRLTICSGTCSGTCDISTHSLTKRLTTPIWQKMMRIENFNSQPHEEADQAESATQTQGIISTHSLTKRLTAISHKNF